MAPISPWGYVAPPLFLETAGSSLPASGEFLDVSPSRIVQTRRYDGDHPTLGRRLTKVTYLFAPLETGTRLTIRHDDFGGSGPEYEHAGGWERYLDWLRGYLENDIPRGGGAMSQFVFLYRESRAPSPQELEARMAKCLVWFKDLERNGHLALYGHPLHRTEGAVVADKTKITDGPYAETKDIVIGFSSSRRRTWTRRRSSLPPVRSSSSRASSRCARY